MGEGDPCCQYQGRLRAVPRPLLAATSGVVIRDRGSRSHTLVHVRFAPKADKSADVSLSPLSARGLNRSRGRALRAAGTATR